MSWPAIRKFAAGFLRPAGEIGPELKRAFDEQVLRALRPASGGVATVFAALSVLHLLDPLSRTAVIPIVALDVVSAGLIFCLWVALRRKRIATRRANLCVLGIVTVVLVNVLVAFVATGDPLFLSYLLILIVGCSALMLSLPWLLASIGLSLVISAPVVWTAASPAALYHYGLPLFVATALAVIISVARVRAAVRTQKALDKALEEADRRRRAEQAVRSGQERLEVAIAGSRGGWWDVELDPNKPDEIPDVIGLDPAIKAFIGFEDDEFPNSLQAWCDRILPEDQEARSVALTDHIAGKTTLFDVEYRIYNRDGHIRWIHSRGRIQRDREGRPIRWSGIDWDISSSKQTEDRLHLLTQAVEQSPSLVLITSEDGLIEYINPSFANTTGYSLEEVLGERPSLFKSDSTPSEIHRDLWQTITAGRQWQGQLTNKRRDGTAYEVNATISPIKNADGVTKHYLAVQEDITERRKVEARLAQTQNLESVGQLVSGVAHDFNNLLTAVIGFAELGLSQAPEGAPLHRELSEIKKAGDCAGELTGQLLAFSRQQVLAPAVLDLNDVVVDIEGLLRRTVRADVELKLALDSDLGAVMVDPAQIRQVLVNLAVNAGDAMLDGGRLTIESRNVAFDGRHAFGSAVPEAGPYVLLAVSDTGHGIDEATQKRVFEPFFTTKQRGQGTGLGLASVYGAVKQSGGFISLYSEVGIGTSFKIYFPRVQEAPESYEGGVAAEVRGGSETILVVEDNAGVRRVATRTLEEGGYRVFSCAEAEEATRVFSEQEIDLLLTDIVMPGMNGASLSQTLRTKKPQLRVLLMSGYAERSVLEAQKLDPDTPFLNKPFRLDELLSKVRGCLEGTL